MPQRFAREFLLCFCAMVLLSVSAGLALADDAKRAPSEVPDDPPGIPARARPGAPPALKHYFGPYTHVQVNVAPGGADIVGDAGNEPSIAVDPTNPQRMAIGWRQFDTIVSNFRQAGYGYSGNGGMDWVFPNVFEPGVFRSDPVLDYDSAGNFYYNSLRVVGSAYDCWVFRSTTGGISWEPGVFSYGGDKQWMTIDRTGLASDGFIYQVCSVFGNQWSPLQFNRSTDGGMSFEVPVTIPGSPIWGTLTVGPDGTVYVAGIDYNLIGFFYVARSTNAMDPMQTPTFDNIALVSMGGDFAYFAGASPNPGGLLGQIQIVADQTTSGPTAGNLYLLACVDPPGADPLDVRLVVGGNQGTTWGPSQRINDDPTDNGAWQWFATMSAAPSGRVDIVWNDTRNTGVVNESQLFYSYSTDGGASWSTNEQLSATFDSHVGWPDQNKIGDYYDMISDDVGANLAWSATFNGGQDVYYTRIGDYDCNANGVADPVDISMGTSLDANGNGVPDECDAVSTAVGPTPESTRFRLYQNVPNPFNPTTTIHYDVAAAGAHVALRIFDTSGRLVRTLVDGFQTAGPQLAVWDGRNNEGIRVASGVYLYRLDAPGFSESRKLVFMK